MDIKTLHTNAMKKLRSLVSKKIRIYYQNGTNVIVPCTISDETIDMLKYTEYVGKDTKVFNILVSDLQKEKAPTTNFMYVEIDRVKYQVQTKINNGVFNNTISLLCLIYREGING